MYYLSQVIIYTALMCLVYLLLLRNRPYHTLSRIFLLCTSLLPLVLPFISFPEVSSQLQAATVAGIELPEFAVESAIQPSGSTIAQLVGYVYMFVASLLLFLNVWRMHALYKVITKGEKQERDGYTIVTDTGIGPGSWYRYILLPHDTENGTVVQHELAHIRLKHTIDIILIHLVQVVFWPNLFLIWIKQELVQVHEFQADAKVSLDKQAYAQMLVSSTLGACTLPGMHSFIVHPLKRRIMMLKKHGKQLPRLITFVATVAFTGILLVNIIGIQSCKTKSWDVKTQSSEVVNKPQRTAEKMPAFPGGNDAFIAFMSENVVYPKEAMEKKIEGRVIVQFTINENGEIIDPEIKKSTDPVLSEAAMNTVRNMPNWVPGEDKGKKVSVIYTLPVSFKLDAPIQDKKAAQG